ncbi:MAG: hypothetical protein KAJ18_00435 [Candidatus Omnitrophica bacterium]|nr:hypothetical protein [Candidatus Omnitrophota bacterium]
MAKVNDLVEWDSCGSSYSVYIKHFSDEGNVGMKMIFEDVTRDKVTEMIIPARKFPAFLRAVNAATPRYNNSII